MTITTDRPIVLLVDDLEQNLFATKTVLRELDIETVTAQSGAEALRLLLKLDVALVLLDVQMPDMDGFEVARLLRQSERTKNTPVIFLTALDQRRMWVQKAQDVGAVDFLSKPIDPDALRRKVLLFTHFWRANRSLAATAKKSIQHH